MEGEKGEKAAEKTVTLAEVGLRGLKRGKERSHFQNIKVQGKIHVEDIASYPEMYLK